MNIGSNPNKNLLKPIMFVTGKGGVGKSVISAALANGLSKSGKKVLLVELGDRSFFEKFFQLEAVSYKPKEIRPGLYLSLWDFKDCLREYVGFYVKSEKLYDLFFGNQVMQRLIEAAPGLKELAILGKATSGPRHVGPAIHYDHVIIDSYSTGHHKALLMAPAGMSKVIQKGPMGVQSEKILEVLKDEKFCQQIIVIKPEDLPTVEGLELRAALRFELNLNSYVICNQSLEMPLTQNEIQSVFQNSRDENFKKMSEYFLQIIQEQNDCKMKIKEKEPGFLEVPFLAEEGSRFQFIDQISNKMWSALNW